MSFFNIGFYVQQPENLIFFIISLVYFISIFTISIIKLNYLNALKDVFVFYSIIWIVSRIFYLNFRYESINYSYLINFNKYDSSLTILMITIFSIILFLGIYLADKTKFHKTLSICFQNNLFKSFLNINSKFLSLYLVLTLIVSYLNAQYFNNGDKIISIINILFSVDSFILIYIYTYFVNKKNNNECNNYFFTFLLLYIFVRTYLGSKGALFIVITTFYISIILTNPNFKINIKKIFILFIILLFSPLLFFIGHLFRLAHDSKLSTPQSNTELSFFNNINFDVIPKIDMISRRLSMFDYLNVFFNDLPSNYYLSTIYSLKMLWNVISPSFLNLEFNYNILPANLFKASYNYGTYSEVANNYHSDMLPLFGFLYINFGLASFLILFFIIFIIACVYKLLINSKIDNIGYIKFFFLVFFIDLIYGMGFVATIQQFLFFTILPLTIFFFLQFLILGLKNILFENINIS